MKYREDMMENDAECPGMRSDRPGITLNDLDLESTPTCLREREGWQNEWMWSGLVEGE